MYCNGAGNSVPVVYEGASADILPHRYRFTDISKLVVYKSYLQLLDQPNFSNIPKTPLDYKNEVGACLSLEEAQDLARPSDLSPLQQELVSWHHRLYHLSYRILFHLASKLFLPKGLLDFRNKPPFFVACKFGQAHHRPWRVKVKKSGSIKTPEQKVPCDGVPVDQIVSA